MCVCVCGGGVAAQAHNRLLTAQALTLPPHTCAVAFPCSTVCSSGMLEKATLADSMHVPEGEGEAEEDEEELRARSWGQPAVAQEGRAAGGVHLLPHLIYRTAQYITIRKIQCCTAPLLTYSTPVQY